MMHTGVRIMRTPLLASFVFIAASACTAAPQGDELADETAEDGESAKADGVDTFGYYVIEADTRACSLDARCGGFFVSRPNRSTVQCGRAVVSDRCYVDSLNLVPTALPASIAANYAKRVRDGETLILRGGVSPSADDRNLEFSATEIWTSGSAVGSLDGVFVLVKQNNIKCITAPCETLTEFRLNSTRFANITEIDLEASGADQAALVFGNNSVTSDGVIVVGYRYYPSLGKGRSANQFFVRAPIPLH